MFPEMHYQEASTLLPPSPDILIFAEERTTALLSVAVNPWRLVNTATTFIAVLGSYSLFLGPMTGLIISSYFVVNKRKINVDDLFVGTRGVYIGILGVLIGELSLL
jgi:cytosine/uracil/thiamine/allantoin permease